MSGSVLRHDSCRLCGGRDLELVLELASTPSGDAYVSEERIKESQELYPLELVLCHSCSLVQLSCSVEPEILYGSYIYNTSKSLGLAEHFQEYADEILDFLRPARGSFVIDIGSNDGTMLKCFYNRGMRVLGIDPASGVAQKAIEFGIETLPTYFSAKLACKIKDEFGPAKIITANNVFANVDNLADLIDGICYLLDCDGIFVFETGYIVDLIQNLLIDNIYHEHLSYYAVRPLESFFRRQGMQLIDIKRVPTKGGSMRGMVQLANNQHPVSGLVNELISLETDYGFGLTGIFHDFAAKIENVKRQLLSLLRKIKLQGKTICCYGASVGVTTLIYYFELGDLLSFIVDDDQSRHNLFSPGYHIPVLSPRAIYERKPDYILILAWRYADIIKKKQGEFLRQGGHFIVPLPEIIIT